jgi:mono/diheme cytochrome c family protein
MNSLLLAIIAILVLAIVFAWLATRAWRLRRPPLRWLVLVISGLLALLLGLVGIVALVGFSRLYRPAATPAPAVQAAASPERLIRGERLAHLCEGCHSTTQGLPLDGGAENFLEGLGTLYPPNLTPAGPLRNWSDGEIVRAIREGVDKDGRALLIMPAEVFRNMSDNDVQAVVAYLRSQPPVPHDTPENGMAIMGTLLIGGGVFPTAVQSATGSVTAPAIAPTREYGAYAVAVAGCRSCHGDALTGGTPNGFGPTPGPNLLAVVPGWTDAQFISTIRTGTDPAGKTLNPDEMPWRSLSAVFTDDELRGIHTYLRDLPR